MKLNELKLEDGATYLVYKDEFLGGRPDGAPAYLVFPVNVLTADTVRQNAMRDESLKNCVFTGNGAGLMKVRWPRGAYFRVAAPTDKWYVPGALKTEEEWVHAILMHHGLTEAEALAAGAVMARFAPRLHKLYEDMCNIGDDDGRLERDASKYESRIRALVGDDVESGICQIGDALEFNRDPRGAPIKLKPGNTPAPTDLGGDFCVWGKTRER